MKQLIITALLLTSISVQANYCDNVEMVVQSFIDVRDQGEDMQQVVDLSTPNARPASIMIKSLIELNDPKTDFDKSVFLATIRSGCLLGEIAKKRKL